MVIELVIVLLLLGCVRLGWAVFLTACSCGSCAATRDETGEELTKRNAEVDRRLVGIDEKIDRRLAELDTKVDRRLESSSKTTVAIHERLAKVDEATAQVLEQAKAFGRLEQALRPPKARGGFGELLLENLLRDRLPGLVLELQYGFAAASGSTRSSTSSGSSRSTRSSRSTTSSGSVRGERRRARALREGVRARPQGPRRRDRVEVHPTRRGHVRLRAHVPAGGVGLLRARLRQDRRAAPVRAREAGLPGLADDVHGPAPGDRARLKGSRSSSTRTR